MGRPVHDGARGAQPARPAEARREPYRPRLGFVVAGAQKAGTTALAQFLAGHPDVSIAASKEVHLFDAPDYSPAWTPEEIDDRYRPHFAHTDFDRGALDMMLGDATPIYLFLPEVAAELKRYNPELRVIVLLRDPVRRAISHYHMERARDAEWLPLWLALLAEPLRLARCRDGRAEGAAMRVHSYRRRGLYSVQLGNLFASFARRQVLLVRSESLKERHEATLRRIFGFLGVAQDVRVPAARVFAGAAHPPHRLASQALRCSYLIERRRLRTLARQLEII